MIELLARFRNNEAADARLAEIANVEPEGVPLDVDGTEDKTGAIADYLSKQFFVRARVADDVPIVRINDASVLAYLNTHTSVRAALEASGLGTGDNPAELDGGTIRLKGRVGRTITQAVSRAVYEDDARPGGIRYFSRLDDTQECWGLFDRVTVQFEEPTALSSGGSEHREAVSYAADTLSIPVPREWRSDG